MMIPINNSDYVTMQGYAILAEALAKQNIQHCYGIVGNFRLIQVFPSSS